MRQKSTSKMKIRKIWNTCFCIMWNVLPLFTAQPYRKLCLDPQRIAPSCDKRTHTHNDEQECSQCFCGRRFRNWIAFQICSIMSQFFCVDDNFWANTIAARPDCNWACETSHMQMLFWTFQMTQVNIIVV